MAYVYRIDGEFGCIFAKWRGVVTLVDNEAFFHDVEGAPDFRSGLNRLHDFRDARFTYSAAEVRNVIRDDTSAGENHGFRKVAMLVSSDLGFGIARMYQTLSNDPNQEFWPFRDLQAALTWLDLPPGLGDPFDRLDQFQCSADKARSGRFA